MPDMSIAPGHGYIHLTTHGKDAQYSQLSSTYPLKLLSSRSSGNKDNVGLLYILTYGGGLVGGDVIRLSCNIDSNAKLVALTQGSTKVFKRRVGERLARVEGASKTTSQHLNVTVARDGALFLLPDPVTCFRSASYDQIQTFRLESGASLVMLDWVTSGRRTLGEEWVFARYYSVNEFWVDDIRLARDVMFLEGQSTSGQSMQRPLVDKLTPYSCYATLILIGPMLAEVSQDLHRQYKSISVFKLARPDQLIWSMSPMSDDGNQLNSWVLRVAGVETETVKCWLKTSLQGLITIIGRDVYDKAFI